MSKKSYIDRIKVNDPCQQDWETMRGNEKARFCDHCSKDVNNLSEMTRKEAVRLVRQSGGNICIRYIKNPANEGPMFADQLIRIGRRAPRLAAGVMSASMSLATMAYSQGGTKETSGKIPIAEVVQSPGGEKKANSAANVSSTGRTLSGVVVDPNGAVIPGARIILGGAVDSRTATSNEDGKYKFDKVPPGNYLIQTEMAGFRMQTTRILIANNEETKHDVGMEVGPIEVSVDIPMEVAMEVGISGGAMIVSYSTPLNRAVADEDIEKVRELIAQGEDVNGRDDDDKITPLFIAVENGNVEIARVLLEFGAKVNARDSERQTPIMRLDDDSGEEMVELLLNYGAKVDLEDKQGNTAIILAAENAEAEVIRALLVSGPDVNNSNEEGQTALMNAAYDDDIDKVRLLLNAGAGVNAKNKDSESAWDQAADEDVEALLVSFGALVKEKERSAGDEHERPAVEDGPAII